MKKEKLQELLKLDMSQRDIAKHLNVSQTTIKYWLKKFELKTTKAILNKIDFVNELKYCNNCKCKKKLDFFYKKNVGSHGTFSSWCKECTNKRSTEKARLMKLRMVNYKGSMCERCKLHLNDTHLSVFEFHHTDKTTKDRDFTNTIKSHTWERVKKEIDKCKLLCSNCHRIVHAEMYDYTPQKITIKNQKVK
jgi:predicted transcriptional regulator